jgi:hypothetical protein
VPPLGIEGEDDAEEEEGRGSGGGVGAVGAGGIKFGLGRLWKGWGREREVVAVRETLPPPPAPLSPRRFLTYGPYLPPPRTYVCSYRIAALLLSTHPPHTGAGPVYSLFPIPYHHTNPYIYIPQTQTMTIL